MVIESVYFSLGSLSFGWFHLCLEISLSLGKIKAIVDNNNGDIYTFNFDHSFVKNTFDFNVNIGKFIILS